MRLAYQTPEIAVVGQTLAKHVLRRHVVQRAFGLFLLHSVAMADLDRVAEVQKLDRAIAREHDVFGFEVAVDHAFAVEVIQDGQKLPAHVFNEL